MHIPVDEQDPDVVIGESLRDIAVLARRVTELEMALDHAADSLGTLIRVAEWKAIPQEQIRRDTLTTLRNIDVMAGSDYAHQWRYAGVIKVDAKVDKGGE